MKRLHTCIIAILLLFSALNVFAQSKGIVINEIYIGGVRTLLANDSYVELYNPTSTTLYLDGCLLARVTANSGGFLQPVAEAWKFPGTAGNKTLPVMPGQFIVICAGAQATSGGLDLSNADYETYAGIPILEKDNPSAKNLRKIGAGTITTDINLSQTLDAIVLTDGEDTVLADGIGESGVIDGVQYSTTQASILPTSIDGGFAGGAGLALGKTMERTQKGVTTHNSGVDFSLYPKATPGYQTGSEPGVLPKGTDIFPLSLGKYVLYNTYETDSNGVIDTSTLTTSSTTVWRENQAEGGFTNVSWLKDTSNTTLFYAGDEANLRYRADENQDIDVLADQEFIGTFVSPFFAAYVVSPNTFVDYFKLSAGFKKPYNVINLSQDIDLQGVAATVTVTTTGSFEGIDTVTVPAGKFDSAYKFIVKGDVVVTAFSIPISSFSAAKTMWLVKGIGIVKSNTPTVNAGGVPITGSERQMTTYGTRAINAVGGQNELPRFFSVLPNPTSGAFEIRHSIDPGSFGQNMKVEMLDMLGSSVRTVYDGTPIQSIRVDRSGLSSGVYFIRIISDKWSELHRVVIQ